MAQAPNAKIPPTVDLKDTDADRKELYAKAGKVFSEERQKAAESGEGQMFVPGQEDTRPLPALGNPPEPEKKELEVDPADKRAFVRAVLGNKSFEKIYTFFGGDVEGTFVDRTSEEMDSIFTALEGKEDDEWSKEADILCLCSSLREIKQRDGRKAYPPTDKSDERRKELAALSRPLYEALLDASRNFETLINHMIEKAREPDFWQAGGSDSPSKRTAGMPSTSPRPGARTNG